MPSPLSRLARRYIRAALRSPDRHVQAIARSVCRRAGILKPDHTYNVTDQVAETIARAIAGALTTRRHHDEA